MRKTYSALILTLLAMMPLALHAQMEMIDESVAVTANEPAPLHPVPSPRQLAWNETEFYAFFHYGPNTFLGTEWGNQKKASQLISAYNPTQKPDPEQWLTAIKAAHMNGAIAVVKHHDGFCLWPTSTTTNCISSCTGTYAKTDIASAFATAARSLGLKYGFYVSPWDANASTYGTQDYIDNVFVKQCEELAQYGSDEFEIWFDGANGGQGYYGGNSLSTKTIVNSGEDSYRGRFMYYDVPNLRYKVHSIAPNCVLWGVGAESRWIGNEDGYADETNWSTWYYDQESTSNQTGKEGYWLWNPGESDAKATSGGWFWHSGETVSSAESLFKIYLETVGRNANLILNFPPNTAGQLPTQDVTVLSSLGSMLETRLGVGLEGTSSDPDKARKATSVTATTTRSGGSYEASNLVDADKDTYWATDDGVTSGSITFDLGSSQTLHYVLLQEYIKKGQRVENFNIQYSTNGSSWTTAASKVTQTTIGYKRIIPLCGSTTSSYSSGITARYIKVNITSSRACPLLSRISIY